ncbi:hypothetical protein RO3G_03896 [Rhizopus delemar RA 99-880]|uniref:Uncharacterized protein n=1 Tax=Rhizopus delemar (strain RA 99-880 / ATCC MYA-4621 / FGSC 9543 / NRRL 43880) TaxID=246409 RepID=I1BSL1_RHIO9|nr:hypothetical protein RO3G_03896 [Rhizopus delemar RA 99-880]|eukprot:EIE79191.1 hypothetical protein RO3G_03896 [Rhizopus delemar RA 99-880]
MSRRHRRSSKRFENSNFNFVFKPEECFRYRNSFSSNELISQATFNTNNSIPATSGSGISQSFILGNSSSQLKRGISEVSDSDIAGRTVYRRISIPDPFVTIYHTSILPVADALFTFDSNIAQTTSPGTSFTTTANRSVAFNAPTSTFIPVSVSVSMLQSVMPSTAVSYGPIGNVTSPVNGTASIFHKTMETKMQVNQVLANPAFTPDTSGNVPYGIPQEQSSETLTPNFTFRNQSQADTTAVAAMPLFSQQKPDEIFQRTPTHIFTTKISEEIVNTPSIEPISQVKEAFRNPFSFGASTALSPMANARTSFEPSASTLVNSSSTSTTLAPSHSIAFNSPAENEPNPFSFDKILKDMSEASTQPPSQIYATLATPSLPNPYPSEIIQHTHFKIDNISSSTRFEELPEEAQKELDELERYIFSQGQKSEYMKIHSIPRQAQMMDKCRKDTESLSQSVDTYSNTLAASLNSTQSLFDTQREQQRQANDGCAVIEAWKQYGAPYRWLFGYLDENEYVAKV